MKREELKKRLEQMDVPKHYYNIDGLGRTDERLCLEFLDDKWEVYFSERGEKTTRERFATEDEACEFLYEELQRMRQL